jgi:hypothetical protein
MGFLKNSNKIGVPKYDFLVRCVLLVPHTRTGLHWSGVSGSHNSEAIEQKAFFHRRWMGILKKLNKIGGTKIWIISEVCLVSTTKQDRSNIFMGCGSHYSELLSKKLFSIGNEYPNICWISSIKLTSPRSMHKCPEEKGRRSDGFVPVYLCLQDIRCNFLRVLLSSQYRCWTWLSSWLPNLIDTLIYKR